MITKHLMLSMGLALSFSAMAQAPQSIECLLRGDCFKADDVVSHLKALQKIAEANNGNRAAGTSGHEFSANYVAQQLLAVGYKVELQPFDFMMFEKHSAKFAQAAPVATDYEEAKLFNVMTYSGSGTVTAAVAGVDIQLGAGNTSSSGCEAEDFANFPQGHIALIQRGTCAFGQKAINAQAAGAAGVVIFNQGNTPDREELLNGTLAEGTAIKIPVFSVSYPFAVDLLKTENLALSLDANTTVDRKVSFNVIAETPGGDPDKVVILGAHLDSVKEGPGINDNGSGSAGILAVALKMKLVDVKNKMRFIWFSAEELGLIGSTKYVAALSEAQKKQIAIMINVDMIGSPNHMIGVYDGDGSAFGTKGPEGSAPLEQMFHSFFASQGIKSVETEFNGRSDYAAFSAAGIPVGGLFTGAEAKKTEEQAHLFGGVAGEAYDACYHKACDDIANLNLDALEVNTNAIAFLAQSMAHSQGQAAGLMKGMQRRNKVVFPKHLHCHGDEHAE